ncbi:transmembrane protein, putative [Bodo saltans]|uniref:Transmembrane protein, putative n=1 Tax=Bodo saltans TaxID=75058 RepID=A0A0S4IW76_BODSA|nr:transmembrane protein, putative [Bodo saltans]|eukprot:CUG26053.1 transmembrane protein, putative [Bodo saltans]
MYIQKQKIKKQTMPVKMQAYIGNLLKKKVTPGKWKITTLNTHVGSLIGAVQMKEDTKITSVAVRKISKWLQKQTQLSPKKKATPYTTQKIWEMKGITKEKSNTIHNTEDLGDEGYNTKKKKKTRLEIALATCQRIGNLELHDIGPKTFTINLQKRSTHDFFNRSFFSWFVSPVIYKFFWLDDVDQFLYFDVSESSPP